MQAFGYKKRENDADVKKNFANELNISEMSYHSSKSGSAESFNSDNPQDGEIGPASLAIKKAGSLRKPTRKLYSNNLSAACMHVLQPVKKMSHGPLHDKSPEFLSDLQVKLSDVMINANTSNKDNI